MSACAAAVRRHVAEGVTIVGLLKEWADFFNVMEAKPNVTTDTHSPRTDAQQLTALNEALSHLMLRDAQRLERRVAGLKRRLRENKPIDRGLYDVQRDLDKARHLFQQREAQPVVLNYPAELPVVERREDILNAIRDHQVVVVAGETGSGKTTSYLKYV